MPVAQNYTADMRQFHSHPNRRCKLKAFREYFEEEELGNLTTVIIGNICFFVVCAAIFWSIYYFFVVDRTFSAIFASAWLIAIANFLSTLSTFWSARISKGMELLQAWAFAIVMVIIWLTLLIYSGIYNFNHHVNANTFLTETQVPVISIDVSKTLEKTVLIQGYKLKDPINRNGKVIFPISRNGNISIVGYVELSDEGTPIIVEKDLHYTPYQSGSQNVSYVARDYLPTKQFFGNWSFQLTPNGDVYFAIAYGDFASLRAGRVVLGILLINATTGECSAYPLNEVPTWVSGISE